MKKYKRLSSVIELVGVILGFIVLGLCWSFENDAITLATFALYEVVTILSIAACVKLHGFVEDMAAAASKTRTRRARPHTSRAVPAKVRYDHVA